MKKTTSPPRAARSRKKPSPRRLNEVKLILVGRGGVGKTSILKRLRKIDFDAQEKETQGVERCAWEIPISNGEKVRAHVWDLAGQEILHATHQLFLTERTLYVVVLSRREGDATPDAEYWFQLIKSLGGDSQIIVVLNKSDPYPYDINRGLLVEKYRELAKHFVVTDCQTDRGIDELRRLIVEHVERMEQRTTDFPDAWFEIKARLAEMTDCFISWDDYQKICRDLGEDDSAAQRQLASHLHTLGIALNYCDDPRLREHYVLNPRWVTDGIYTLLRAGQKTPREPLLSRQSLANTLPAATYPVASHAFLLHLMEKFHLCFRMQHDPDCYLMPELLGENQPDDLGTLLSAPSLSFRYEYDVLPEGLLPRFIVQTHRHMTANQDWRWRTGVVLQRADCMAVVRADIHQRRVDIHITGKKAPQRRELLAIIRDHFEAQHDLLKSLNVSERVPIPGEPGITISYRHLLTLEEEKEVWCRPDGAKQKWRVVELLNGLESPGDRELRRSREKCQQACRTATGGGPDVFISYSHVDGKYLAELQVHLAPYERNDRLVSWSDEEIEPGTPHLDEIRKVLRVVRVAVMLVSPEFLASEFIYEQELCPLLREAEQSGVTILWLLVRACAYDNCELKDRHPVVPHDKPLAQLRSKSARDQVWVKVCKQIDQAVHDAT